MIKFNDYHIFTGEIKQILADFNLPKYKSGRWLKTDDPSYYFGKYVKNYTKNLEIKTNAYDTYTHEYLGWYLRFLRDYKNLNLMPLYNCFSDNACAGLSLKVCTSTTTATFNSSDSNYKIYSLPIMLGQKYTIAIDCNFKVEICCAVIGKYLNSAQLNVPMTSYKAYNSMNFNKPELYDTSALLNIDGIDNYESDIRMLIKLPINNSSSIVVLEGDYLKWNDTLMSQRLITTVESNEALVWETVSNRWITNFDNEEVKIYGIDDRADENGEIYKVNVLKDKIIPIDESCANFKPITPLQLLRINSGTSHPFADRLMEYLTKNAITGDDDISDNIERVQQTMSFAKWTNTAKDSSKEQSKKGILENLTFDQIGLWDDRIRPTLYNAMQIDRFNGNDKNHDILGYVDKDVETYYHTYEYNSGKDGAAIRITHTIGTEDIYPDMYQDSK